MKIFENFRNESFQLTELETFLELKQELYTSEDKYRP